MAIPPTDMDNTLDRTTLATIDLLESRLLRIEHLLYGHAAAVPPIYQEDSAAQKLKDMERRFSMVVSHFRVYGELLKIYKSNPDFFHAPDASVPPSQLPSDAIQSIVLSQASAYFSTLSSLASIKDSPIPDPSESSSLVALTDRMKAMEATRIAQSAEMADLRRRSEMVMRAWYENWVLVNSQSLADVETRVERVEKQVRQKERAAEDARQI
ncbi:uncharacterized protein MAM_02189 [Metarhizium album ARSEF 1941]|uniref:Nuclear distribution protein n=1 Tax=Metarhizium album (strain ARSEF 1941) TaxID=1081103 RepID=A0A0B2X4R6_METAS|nr:uncharacterized protein MAM_02189 [Metarhizium album ARSEF 1941]KHO00266.1 hypothetical protein MAM_02189 [Metarhizium album ARSEF 1941]